MNAEQIETFRRVSNEIVDFIIGFLLGVFLYHAVVINDWL